jgi:cAMP-specific phosphodiesterase 4
MDVLMTQSAKTLLGELDDCWNLDVLKLHEVTGGRPLFALFWTVMHKHRLLGHMKCSPGTFSNFITRIEDGYLDNPYHNSTHGADVLNGCHHFVQQLGFKEIITTWQTYSLFISAAIHDFEHPGVSNAFLINTKNPLAVLYNDTAVCESMHVARAFEVMQEPGGRCNILQGISEKMYRKVRQCIIDTVMVTDLSKHIDFTARLRTITATGKSEGAFADQGLLLQIAIKCSDIGHCSKARPLHLKWTKLIVEEMFRQGDKERERGDQISSFCDRTSADTSKNQIGFFEFVILPWWRALWQLDGRFGKITHATEANHQYWIEVRDAENDPSGSGRSLNREKTRSKSVMTLTMGDSAESLRTSSDLKESGATRKTMKVAVKKSLAGNRIARRASDSSAILEEGRLKRSGSAISSMSVDV